VKLETDYMNYMNYQNN